MHVREVLVGGEEEEGEGSEGESDTDIGVEEEEEDANREDVSMSSANEESGQSARYKSQAKASILQQNHQQQQLQQARGFAKADIRVFVDAEFVSTRVTQQSRWKYEWEKHR